MLQQSEIPFGSEPAGYRLRGLVSQRPGNSDLCLFRSKGDPFAQRDLNKVRPQSFFQEKDYLNWIVVDASEKHVAQDLIPRAVSVPFTDDGKLFTSKIKTVVSKSERNSLLSILIVSEAGEKYDMIEKDVENAGIENVFYLKGGVKGYRRFLEDQVLMWQQGKNIHFRMPCGLKSPNTLKMQEICLSDFCKPCRGIWILYL